MSKPTTVAVVDEAIAAKLLWQLKAIATKEVANLPLNSIDSFLMLCPSTSEESTVEGYSSASSTTDARKRSVSFESVEKVTSNTITPILSYTPVTKTSTLVEFRPFLLDSDVDDEEEDDDDDDGTDSSVIDHHDWSSRNKSVPNLTKSMMRENSHKNHHPISHPLLGSPEEVIKQCKRKRESFVGLTTSTGTVRCTLRKKFSWKQYPELEDYLLRNQDEYFEFSSRNYTSEQRKYNNTLTRGLLELASGEGYVFEDFTFSMVRDRIRCYYKSHSQSAKKKRRR